MPTVFDRVIQLCYKLAYRLLLCIWYLFRPSTKGAYVAVWHGGRILIIKNSYRNLYTCPSGTIKRGEDEKTAALRELHEEVGIRVTKDQLKLAGRFFCTHEFKKDTVAFFEVHFSQRPKVTVDNREVIWGDFLTPEKALALHLSPHLKTYLKSHLFGLPPSQLDAQSRSN